MIEDGAWMVTPCDENKIILMLHSDAPQVDIRGFESFEYVQGCLKIRLTPESHKTLRTYLNPSWSRTL